MPAATDNFGMHLKGFGFPMQALCSERHMRHMINYRLMYCLMMRTDYSFTNF